MSIVFINEENANNVLQYMWQQCESKELYDIVLIAGSEEKEIPAHRSVLCASSDYFEKMFTPPFNESTAKEVKLPSADSKILKCLIKYFYTGRIEISVDNVEKLLGTADLLLLRVIVNACGNFLGEHLHPTNCLGFAHLAERHQIQSLLKKAKDFCLEHFVDICKTDEFLSLNAEQLGELLGSDDLCVANEEVVFNSLLSWLEHERFEREQHKEQLLKLVRMPLIKPLFLYDNVKSLCTTTESHQLYVEALEWQSVPERHCTLNARKSTKTRRSPQFLMAIKEENNKTYIMYHCPHRLKWMKPLEGLADRALYGIGIALMEDHLFIVGGKSESGVTNGVLCLNMKTMALKDISPMNYYRYAAGAAELNGFLYAVGGHSKSNYLSSVEKWDSKTNAWSEVASMSVSRFCPGIVAFNEKLYAVGGLKSSQNPLSSAECYDPQLNVWTSIASMNIPHESPGVAVANGMLYAMGGIREKTIERYDPASDKWTKICCLNDGIDGDFCTTFGNKVMLLYSDRVEEYNPGTNECKVNASINGLTAVRLFSYSGELLLTKFVEN